MHSPQASSAPGLGPQDFEAERDRVQDHAWRPNHTAQTKAAQEVRPYKDLVRYAKADCLQLTQMMCEKLTKELRYMVYQYICIEEQHIPVGPYYHFRPYRRSSSTTSNAQLGQSTKAHFDIESEDEEIDVQVEAILLPDGRVKEDHSSQPASDILMPQSHIFNPKYVGSKVACETQEVYYTYNTFSICNVDHGIQRFLEEDTTRMFHLKKQHMHSPGEYKGVKPVQFVQKLQIRLKCEHFFDNMAGVTDIDELYKSEQGFLNDLQASVEKLPALLKHPRAQDLSIEFVLMTELVRPSYHGTNQHLESLWARCFVNILQALRNTVFQLMYDCGKTTVTFIHHDERLGAFPRNITGLYSLSKEQWDYEKEKNVGKDDWTREFYVLPAGTVVGELTSGFSHLEMDILLQERWGMSSALNTRSQQPVREGKYWPGRKNN